MRSRQYANALPEVPSGRDRSVAGAIKGENYFLKRRSNASRASVALRGAGALTPEIGCRPAFCPETSRATVTRGENNVQLFAWSLIGMRTGMGFMHWKRVEDSKFTHCLQQCS